MKTREQLRAERAALLVSKLGAPDLADYATEIKSFPASVQQNGLGAALAFLRQKSTPAKSSVHEHISTWVAEVVFAEPKSDLLSLIVKNPAARLMRAHEESLAFATWLKRFAEAREPKARKA